jgi:GTP cyclohydrolase I
MTLPGVACVTGPSTNWWIAYKEDGMPLCGSDGKPFCWETKESAERALGIFAGAGRKTITINLNSSPEREAVRTIIRFLGYDPDAEGLRGTPRRFINALVEMAAVRSAPAHSILKTFPQTCDEMVVVRDLPFSSVCMHHLMPFRGTAAIGYVPAGGKVVGLSKLPRLLRWAAAALTLQEQIVEVVTGALNEVLKPRGAACVIRATHTCMSCRGVRSEGTMVTSSLTGVFRDDHRARTEFLMLAGVG